MNAEMIKAGKIMLGSIVAAVCVVLIVCTVSFAAGIIWNALLY